MTSIQTIEQAWFPGRSRPSSIDMLREVLCALEEGRIVRQDAAAHLALALRRYFAGEHDITANLGLRPGKGKRPELSQERKAARDIRIRSIYQSMKGTRTEKAKRTAELLTSAPRRTSLIDEITEGDVMAHLFELHREHGGELPKSWPHILRVVGPDE